MDLMEYVLNLQGEFTKGIESQTKRLNELEIKLDKIAELQYSIINNELTELPNRVYQIEKMIESIVYDKDKDIE
jgi:hypothetical protein